MVYVYFVISSYLFHLTKDMEKPTIFGTILFLLLLPMIDIIASSVPTDNCSSDLAVISEIPPEKRNHVMNQVRIFYQGLLLSSACLRGISLHIADGIYFDDISDFSNITINGIRKNLDKIVKLQRRKPNFKRSSKMTIYQKLQNPARIFSTKRGADKKSTKVILLIFSTEAMSPNYLSQLMALHMENGYEILAVGVDNGQGEDLLRITFNERKLKRLPLFSNLYNEENLEDFKKARTTYLLVNSISPDALAGSVGSSQGAPIIPTAPLASEFRVDASEQCEYAADIAFMIDSSYSIRLDYWKELMFVQEIAKRYNISETGTRAGVVAFSDHTIHTKVPIKLKDYFTTQGFIEAVAKIKHIGYKTRIDYGFRKVRDELFTNKGGARPNMNKIIFLITDGKQNPKTSRYDPVKASQSFYDSGVNIFAVGVGSQINETELKNIVRKEEHMFKEDTFDRIISEDFIKKVSKSICKPAVIPTKQTTKIVKTTPTAVPTTTEKVTESKPGSCCCMSKCGGCCRGRDVYVNIFNGGTGPIYIMQGIQLAPNSTQPRTLTFGNKQGGKPSNKTAELLTEDTINLLQNLPGGNHQLLSALQDQISKQSNQPKENKIFRKRRDLNQEIITLRSLLNSRSDLSIYRKLFQKYSLDEILMESNQIQKVCFEKDLCVKISNQMKKHFQTLHKTKQLTFITPINEALLKTTKLNEKDEIEFLKNLIYFGELELAHEENTVAAALSQKSMLNFLHGEKEGRMITTGDGDIFTVVEKMKVKEGTVIIVE